MKPPSSGRLKSSSSSDLNTASSGTNAIDAANSASSVGRVRNVRAWLRMHALHSAAVAGAGVGAGADTTAGVSPAGAGGGAGRDTGPGVAASVGRRSDQRPGFYAMHYAPGGHLGGSGRSELPQPTWITARGVLGSRESADSTVAASSAGTRTGSTGNVSSAAVTSVDTSAVRSDDSSERAVGYRSWVDVNRGAAEAAAAASRADALTIAFPAGVRSGSTTRTFSPPVAAPSYSVGGAGGAAATVAGDGKQARLEGEEDAGYTATPAAPVATANAGRPSLLLSISSSPSPAGTEPSSLGRDVSDAHNPVVGGAVETVHVDIEDEGVAGGGSRSDGATGGR